MIRILIATAITVVVCAGFALAMLPPFRALDREHRNIALAVFGWVSYVLGAFAFALVLIGFTWVHIGGVALDDGANVGDVRCQRYTASFNGKTTSYEWQTVACVELGKGA